MDGTPHWLGVAVVAGSLLTTTSTAQQAGTTADDPSYGSGLQRYCAEAATSMNGRFCEGYIDGVVMADQDSGLTCVPPILSSQMVSIVRKYLDQNPSELHLLSTELVSAAMKQTYPCGGSVPDK